MNRNPQFPANKDAPSSREETIVESIIWSIVYFVFIVGIRRLFRLSLGGGGVLEAAVLSLCVNFGVPAIIRYTERRDSILIRRTLPLP